MHRRSRHASHSPSPSSRRSTPCSSRGAGAGSPREDAAARPRHRQVVAGLAGVPCGAAVDRVRSAAVRPERLGRIPARAVVASAPRARARPAAAKVHSSRGVEAVEPVAQTVEAGRGGHATALRGGRRGHGAARDAHPAVAPSPSAAPGIVSATERADCRFADAATAAVRDVEPMAVPDSAAVGKLAVAGLGHAVAPAAGPTAVAGPAVRAVAKVAGPAVPAKAAPAGADPAALADAAAEKSVPVLEKAGHADHGGRGRRRR